MKDKRLEKRLEQVRVLLEVLMDELEYMQHDSELYSRRDLFECLKIRMKEDEKE